MIELEIVNLQVLDAINVKEGLNSFCVVSRVEKKVLKTEQLSEPRIPCL